MTRERRFGPGLLVTAAFIGPGTITTATRAGAGFGFALLWVLVFAVAATIILQEMSARVGLVTRNGLGEALQATLAPHPTLRVLAAGLVIVAIAFGNAAFQTGNILGAALGLEAILGGGRAVWSLAVGATAAVLILTGTYPTIERILIGLVALMSGVFLLTAGMTKPDASAMVRGMVHATVPAGALTTTIALIGTTVVPYNLFLHASAVQETWGRAEHRRKALSRARWDTALAVTLGGIITLAIVVTAATFYASGTPITDAADMARQLEPLLGRAARTFFAAGLFAAGLTSSITAPLAAAYATAGVVGFKPHTHPTRFRLVGLAIVVAGTGCALAAGGAPLEAIIAAQAANALLLPVVAAFLLMVMNRRDVLGAHVNGPVGNALGVSVLVIVTVLSGYKAYTLF